MYSILFFLLAISPLVVGHGYLASVTVDGKSYQGNTPGSSSISSPIRMISDIGPVKGTNNTDLGCGLHAQKAAAVAAAQPGSTVSFKWVSNTGGNWIHAVGPLLTYMASCGSSGCTSFDHTHAQWFKIAQSALRSDGTWAMHDLYVGKSDAAFITLPANLAPGEYLIRHELLALHGAQAVGGAEFYPACAQLRVGGSKSGSAASTVSFPGAYSDYDKGILVDAYTMTGDYVFPGPAISDLTGSTAVITTEVSEVDSGTFTPETSGQYKVLIFPRRGVSRIMRSLNLAQ